MRKNKDRCPQHAQLTQHAPYVEPFQVLSNIERHEHQLKVVDPEQGPIACIATRVFGEHGIHMLVRLPQGHLSRELGIVLLPELHVMEKRPQRIRAVQLKVGMYIFRWLHRCATERTKRL